MKTPNNTLLLSTRKGLIVYKRARKTWQYEAVHFRGIPVSLTFTDSRNGTWWACLDHGHWGVKLHRSEDCGGSWEEVPSPQFPDGAEIKPGVPATVQYLWAMAGTGSGRLLLGTIPGGLFQSRDNGGHFELVKSLWGHPSRPDGWFGGGYDHPGIHSIVVDPRDPDHLHICISVAGVFESRDGGQTWTARNKGLRADFLPDPHAEIGHDPHLMVACAANPDVLWQQNHCGIFRSTDGGQNWEDISQADGPARFGFAIAADAENAERAWVAPAVSDGMRVAVGDALRICRTDDGGKSWQDFRRGLPQEHCFDIVYRHALAANGDDVVFGTTTGNLFVSEDAGESWKNLAFTLPMVYAAAFADS